MKRRLFLTGPIGCGKSTAIASALGERITRCGGFVTRRYREPRLHFTMESLDRKRAETFLDFADGKPEIHLSVFSGAPLQGKVLVLDEIGGIELLNPDFTAALEAVLRGDTPILGVIKGDGPAGALVEALGLTVEYARAASRLREQLCSDRDTLVYECGQFDQKALYLAEQWVKEYAHD